VSFSDGVSVRNSLCLLAIAAYWPGASAQPLRRHPPTDPHPNRTQKRQVKRQARLARERQSRRLSTPDGPPSEPLARRRIGSAVVYAQARRPESHPRST
jgi:hypothetical protein